MPAVPPAARATPAPHRKKGLVAAFSHFAEGSLSFSCRRKPGWRRLDQGCSSMRPRSLSRRAGLRGLDRRFPTARP